MKKSENIIDNINKIGSDNDMIDYFENALEKANIGDDLKNQLYNEIIKLKQKYENQKIRFTKNEQDELVNLFNYVILDDSLDSNDKYQRIVNIMNYKIRKEIQETKDRENQWTESPEKIIDKIKKTDFENYGKVGKSFLGDSEYAAILIHQIHPDSSDKTSDKDFAEIITVQKNILGIQEVLLKNGISKTFGIEGFSIREFSKELPYKKSMDAMIVIRKLEILKNNPKKNKEQIDKIEKAITYVGYDLYPETLHDQNIDSFGIEDFLTFSFAYDIDQVYDTISSQNDMSKKELEKKLNEYIKEPENFLTENKEKYGLSDNDISEYIGKLKDLLEPEFSIWGFDFLVYKFKLLKKKFEYQIDLRNLEISENFETIHDDTLTNAISVKLGAQHFDSSARGGLIDIIPITEILEQKGISYVEIIPNGELDPR